VSHETANGPIARKKSVVLPIFIVLMIAAVMGVTYWRKHRPLEITYEDISVSRGDLEVSIVATGVVSPENRLEIKPPIAGRVEKVLVAEGAYVKKGQILAWMSSTERAALLDAAGAQGPDEVKKWEELYRSTPILAPIDGTIILKSVESGQTFTSSDSVLVMSDRLTIKAQVDETDISQIKLGQGAEFVLDAYPDETVSARVDQIAYDAKTVNNVTTYEIDVLPLSKPKFMRSGMTANVTFLVATKKNILLLPADAIKTRDDDSGDMYVLVKSDTPRGKPVEKNIETGLSDGKKTEIVSGLKEGDIVVEAQFKLSDKKSAANPFSPFGGGGGRKKK